MYALLLDIPNLYFYDSSEYEFKFVYVQHVSFINKINEKSIYHLRVKVIHEPMIA